MARPLASRDPDGDEPALAEHGSPRSDAPPGRRPRGDRAAARQGTEDGARADRRAARPGVALARARALGRPIEMYRGVGRRAGARASSRSIGSVHGRRVMVVANDATVKAGALLPDDDQEDPPRPGDRRRRTGCRWSTSSIPRACSCRCRTRSSPTRTTSAGSSATTRCSRRGDSPVRGDHGELRRGRRLPAGPLRHGADDRGLGPLPRRARRW